MPTQIGSTVSLPASLRITMGMLVTGSIMRPRIFISTSIVISVKLLIVEFCLLNEKRGRAVTAALETPGLFNQQSKINNQQFLISPFAPEDCWEKIRW